MKNSKLYLMLALIAVSFIACEKEEPGIMDDSDQLNQRSHSEKTQLQIKVFEERGEFGEFYSDYFYNNKKSETEILNATRLCSSPSGSNNLISCSTMYQLPKPPTNPIVWGVLNNGSGYIDYEFESIFNAALDFNYYGWPRAGIPTQTTYGEAEFYESPSYNPSNGQYDIYEYLNANLIPMAKLQELRTHFACEIDNYRDTNMPGALITNVDFYGDILLCGSSVRYLKASFTMSYY